MNVEIDEDLFCELIQDWFNKNQINISINKANFWRLNKVAKTIKNNLKQYNKWKNCARRKPPKGVKPTYEKKMDW